MLTGKRLGRYEIREKIGSGGMGEVYLAHDTQLDRKVALKVLLSEFCSDAERVQRFKLEAKAASALNHPNIITIHEVGESDGLLYIATEYVNGETLREKIVKGGLSLSDSIRIAEQVADAISAAHEAFIVHRDIKPENIMIRRDGYAKILDFGLAKPTPQHSPGAEEATMQMVQTQAGLVMGSVRYMSPEQARGKKTDERTDVWSLGVVLYETITGKNPFEGETVSDSLAALIHVHPEPLDHFVPGVPEELQAIISRALSKDADDRYQAASDMAADLRHVHYQLDHSDIAENKTMNIPAVSHTDGVDKVKTTENPTLIHRTLSAEVEESRKSGDRAAVSGGVAAPARSRTFLPVMVVLIAAVVGVGAWWLGPRIIETHHPAFDNVQVSRLTDDGKAFSPEISPDGKYVAFVNYDGGLYSLMVRQVGTDSGIQIVPRTSARIPQPTFSLDGNHIYYTLVENGVGTVYQIPTLGVSVNGGAPKKVVTDVDTKISFSPDGKQFVFARHNPSEGGDWVVIVNSDGTDTAPFIDTKEIGYDAIRDVAWSPDGNSILVGAYKRTGDGQQRVKLLLISVKDRTLKAVDEKAWLGAYSFNWLKDGSGFLFVAKSEAENSSQIWYMSYPEGASRQITNDLSDYVSLSLADDNKTMATSKVDTISSFLTLDATGKELKQITSENRNNAGFGGISTSGGGKIYYTKRVGKGVSIMEANVDGSDEKQLVSDGTMNLHPAVSRDQKYIVFTSNRSGSSRVWRTGINGADPVQLSDEADSQDFRPQVSVNNTTVIFTRATKDGGRSALMSVPLEGGATKPLLPEGTPIQVASKLSLDGRKIAYCTVTFDQQRISIDARMVVAGFNGRTVEKVEKEVPMAWGENFDFSPDGRSLIYVNADGGSRIWEYPLDTGKPRQLTELTSGKVMGLSWSSDGKKLYIVRGVVNSDLILIRETQK
jgi:serine/threonine protein kinase/Tol biopolymer transport system component